VRRVLVVDDHVVVSELIAKAVTAEPDLECVGVADDVGSALAKAAALRPDTVLLDAQLPSGDGVELVTTLREILPELRVLLLTARPRADRERAAFEAGAVGYLGKDGRLSDLLAALRNASPAEPARDPQLARRGGEMSARGLSRRETEVLELLAEGHHVQDIARALGLSPFTARDHVKALLAKLGARSQLEAVAIAARDGLVRVGGS
jgi:DNA-binding NarL/FixJ family response regulator